MTKFHSLLLATLALAAGSFLALTPGCTKSTISTVGPNGTTNVFTSYTMDPVALHSISLAIENGIRIGAKYGLGKSPNVKAYLQALEVELSTAANSGNYNATTLSNALHTVSIDEIRNDPSVIEFVDNAQGILAIAESAALQKVFAKADCVQPFLVAFDMGLREALSGQ